MQQIVGVTRNNNHYTLKVVTHHRSRASQSHLQPIHSVDTTETEAKAALLDAQLNGRLHTVNRTSKRQWDADFILTEQELEDLDYEQTVEDASYRSQ